MWQETKGNRASVFTLDDGELAGGANEIRGFHREQDLLVYRWRIMPLVSAEWSITGLGLDDVVGIGSTLFEGEAPELLLLTRSGVYAYAPWHRVLGGVEQLEYYPNYGGGSPVTVAPQGKLQLPPQVVNVGNRTYLTWGDGGQAWVVDWGHRLLRTLGYTQAPPAPLADGPSDNNQGGFSVQGRIGSTEGDWTNVDGETVGGIDDGSWSYKVVFESIDGAYSEASSPGGPAWVYRETVAVGDDVEKTRRRFRVYGIAQGPPGTVARILLRTPNILRVPPGGSSAYRFLVRIPHNEEVEWIDDTPDGELGPEWVDRAAAPVGAHLLSWHDGSLWMGRTAGAPARLWWSEQTNVNGPTPEGFMAGHWLDVFPGSGPLTALQPVRMGSQNVTPAMLALKDGAAHLVVGTYPDYQAGTLHDRAGCAGPGVIQPIPDGTIVWYGNGTFWRLNRDGAVEDIGGPIKRRLRKVNAAMARMGVSWLDTSRVEAVFCLPWKGQDGNRIQFCWDYEAQGWRTREDVTAITAAHRWGPVTLVAATWATDTTVWVYGRGYQGSGYETGPGCEWRSPWLVGSQGPNVHARSNSKEISTVFQEGAQGTTTLYVYADWNADDPTSGPDILGNSHPDSSSLVFYQSTSAPAVWNVSKWRTVRYFPQRRAIDAPSASAVMLKLTSATALAVAAIDHYGITVARPGSRAPEQA